MCGSSKYPYPHHRGSLEILRGRGGALKAKFLKKSMNLNWNFQRGGGPNQKKTLCEGSMDIFWNNTMGNEPMSSVTPMHCFIN